MVADREDKHQVALFDWARAAMRAHPELALLFAVPNGQARSPGVGRALKRGGVKAGVPDVCLPVARHGYGSLWIELKRPGKHTVSEGQAWWVEQLNEHGQRAVIAVGWDQARDQLLEYLGAIE